MKYWWFVSIKSILPYANISRLTGKYIHQIKSIWLPYYQIYLWEYFPFNISILIHFNLQCCAIENYRSLIHVSSKSALFKTSWFILRLLPHLSPLDSCLLILRSFQWNTLWPCTSRGIKNKASRIKSSIFNK